MPFKRKRWRVAGAVLAMLALAWAVRFFWPSSPPPLEVGHETTRVSGPRNPDGTIDYVAALNARFGEGVRPEDNAAVGLAEALGPALYPPPVRERGFRRLEIPVPPERGDYLIPLGKYVETHYPIERLNQLTARRLRKLQAEGTLNLAIETGDRSAALDAKIAEELRQMTDEARLTLARQQVGEDFEAAMAEPWTADRLPLVAEWLDAGASALEKVEAATRRPTMFLPLAAPGAPEEVMQHAVGLGELRHVSAVLVARAMRRLGDGRADEAWSDALTIYRLGRLIGQRPPTLVHALVGLTIESRAADVAIAIARHADLSPEQARAMLADLDHLPPTLPIAEVMDRAERLAMLDGVMMLWRQTTLGGGSPASGAADVAGAGAQGRININTMLRRMNLLYDAMMHELDPQMYPATVEFGDADFDIEAVVKRRAQKAISPSGITAYLLSTSAQRREMQTDLIAHMMLGILLPAVGAAQSSEEIKNLRTDQARLALALRAFRTATGTYPDQLSELVPDYIDRLPIDPYADAPMRYRLEGDGYLLYSIGRNREDDGGEDDGSHWLDITVRTGSGPPDSAAP